jgi:signal transduction histidine kinase
VASKLCLLVCQNFLAEAAAIVAEENFADVQVAAFAPTCIRPTGDADAIGRLAAERAGPDSDVVVFGGYCLHSLATPERGLSGANRVQVASVPRCLEFAAPAPLVDAQIEAGAYLLTPGWLSHWRRTMTQWGFDQPTARAFFAETTRKLVLLDTGTDAQSDSHLRELADFLALPGEVIPVGLDLLRLRLIKVVLEWRLKQRKDATALTAAYAKQQMADYAMAFDLIGGLTELKREGEVAAHILDIIAMLCAPARLWYQTLVDGQPGELLSRADDAAGDAAQAARLAEFRGDYELAGAGSGFTLRLGNPGETLAVVAVDGLAFPQRSEHYLNLMLSLRPVFILGILNARTFEHLEHARSLLQVDITERRRAEAQLKATLAELERSNAELENFAYIASHDLQEPLRMVTSYLQLLEMDYGDQLDSDAREFIAYAVDGAQRMRQLINDLLEYSRVSTRAAPFAPTDCEQILGYVLHDLQESIAACDATVTHDPLPTLLADRTQMGQLLQNLIANALKFRGTAPPVVHVSARAMDDVRATMDDGRATMDDGRSTMDDVRSTMDDVGLLDDKAASPIEHRTSNIVHRTSGWEFSVRDNGIGIAAEDQTRIFGLFQRLHTREEYPGTGIGLAVCQKIVERHGGRIWVESAPGEGARFHFTIPTMVAKT